MSDPVDTGFDDVLAGEKWEDPSLVVVDGHPVTAAVNEHFGFKPPLPLYHEVPEVNDKMDDAVEEALKITRPDDAIVQATKALVKLPPIDYPTLAKLARDVAMDIKERHVILRDYNLDQAQYDYLETYNEFFKNALAAASIEWHAPLSTAERIKIEAAAILEDSLPGLGARMQNKSEGLPGVIEAAKLFAKVAGVGEREAGSAASGERFTINIDLGGDQRIAVTTGGGASPAAQQPERGSLQHDAQALGGFLKISTEPEG